MFCLPYLKKIRRDPKKVRKNPFRGLPVVRIDRQDSNDFGTLGTLSAGGLNLRTIELPWKDNQSNVSCIPTGDYLCTIYSSPKYGMVYIVTGVAGRSYILFHGGNVAGDTALGYKTHSRGCILLGMRFGKLWGQDAVLSSKVALRLLMDHMAGNDFKLEIR